MLWGFTARLASVLSSPIAHHLRPVEKELTKLKLSVLSDAISWGIYIQYIRSISHANPDVEIWEFSWSNSKNQRVNTWQNKHESIVLKCWWIKMRFWAVGQPPIIQQSVTFARAFLSRAKNRLSKFVLDTKLKSSCICCSSVQAVKKCICGKQNTQSKKKRNWFLNWKPGIWKASHNPKTSYKKTILVQNSSFMELWTERDIFY